MFEKLRRKFVSAKVTSQDILATLKKVNYPGFKRDIVSFGLVKDVQVDADGNVGFRLELNTEDQKIPLQIEADARKALKELDGVKNIAIRSFNAGQAQAQTQNQPQAQKIRPPDVRNYLPQVKCKIAVASGKGGVGKSTVAINLALALARTGASVGLYDVDIYGPSLPLMTGITEPPESDGQRIFPHQKFGLQLMSIGFLVPKDSALIWRGPMVMKAIDQLFTDVVWREDLDYLIFDMPPGTGDAQLSLSQLTKLNGAVIVTTPNDVALADVVKGINMFRKIEVPIFGIVENMSYFSCPHCQEKSYVFDHGGAMRIAEEMSVPFLGEIPLHATIRYGGDKGIPIVESEPDSTEARAFMDIAKKVVTIAKSATV